MELIAGDLTSSIIKKLPLHKEWYSTKELLAAGLPFVVVERIRLELEQTLARNLTPPETLWADLESNASIEAWKSYINSIRNEVVLPAEYAEKIILTVIDECFKLAVQPSKAVPEVLFGNEKVLTYQVISERIPAILINGHLAKALSRYLEKKELQGITFEKASEVIEKIDEKLVEGYNPLNWKDVIMPIFAISAGSASSEHIALFFDDKKRPGIAKAFRELEKNLSDTEFIEKMSSAEVLEINEYYEDLTEPQVIEQAETYKEETEDIQKESIEDSDETEHPGHEEEKVVSDESEGSKKNDIEKNGEDKAAEEASLNDLFDEDDIYETESSEEQFDTSFDFSEDAENDEKEKAVLSGDPHQFESVEESGHDDDDDDEQAFHQDAQENDEDELSQMPEEKPNADKEVHEEEEETLLSRFILDDPDAEEEIRKPSAGKKPRTIYDELNLVKEEKKQGTIISLFDDLEGMEKDTSKAGIHDEGKELEEKAGNIEDLVESDGLQVEKPEIENIEEPDQSISLEQESDVPMWKSFLDRGDVVDDETPFALDDSEHDEDLLDEDGFIETPIFDFSGEDEPFKKAFGELSNWLNDDRERFIKEIFGGSETAYDITLAEIINYENWKNASKFLEREVFLRNRIDLYSEVAVDFTDRLHTYFIEYKS